MPDNYFTKARDFVLYSPHFGPIHGSNINVVGESAHGLKDVLKASTLSASHDSGAPDPPRCHQGPGTTSVSDSNPDSDPLTQPTDLHSTQTPDDNVDPILRSNITSTTNGATDSPNTTPNSATQPPGYSTTNPALQNNAATAAASPQNAPDTGLQVDINTAKTNENLWLGTLRHYPNQNRRLNFKNDNSPEHLCALSWKRDNPHGKFCDFVGHWKSLSDVEKLNWFNQSQ